MSAKRSNAESRCRAFLPRQVATETIVQALKKAARAPSGGNLQPWHVVVVDGEKMTAFRALMEERLAGMPIAGGEAAEYAVYPPNLKEPYRTRRFREWRRDVCHCSASRARIALPG